MSTMAALRDIHFGIARRVCHQSLGIVKFFNVWSLDVSKSAESSCELAVQM